MTIDIVVISFKLTVTVLRMYEQYMYVIDVADLHYYE